MNKIFFIAALAALIFLGSACNNSADTSNQSALVKTKADTLLDDVNHGHNVGMGRMGKLITAQKEVNRLIDSIGRLPAKAQQASATYKAKLTGLLDDLKSAENRMEKWMHEFNMDSALNDTEKRIEYLSSEKGKVTEVKDAILNSLQKADSVLKEKF